jgi:hypothetical protein
MTAKTYKFIVPDLKKEIIPVRVPHVDTDCVESIMSHAAMVFFYGVGGWELAWPLKFLLYTESGTPISTAEIFILSAEPQFDPIIVKSDFNEMNKVYKELMINNSI